MRTVHLREHQTTVVEGLSPADVLALARSRARLSIQHRADGRHEIRAAEVVGSFAAGGARVVISPKMPIRRLFHLFGYAVRAPWLISSALVDAEDDLLVAMQKLYAHALEEGLRDGLVRAYRTESDRLVAPRGRIDAMKLVSRRFGVLPPTDCEFEEFTADVEVNRRLLAAANLLARFAPRGSAVSTRLRALAARMIDVTEVTYAPRSITPLSVDRRFDRVTPALRLAELVLRHGSIELRDGRTHSVGVLADMDEVYEDFVAEGLRGTMPAAIHWVRQPPGFHLAEGRRVRLEPDVVYFDRARVPRVVVDVKYKATEEAKREDLYQMVAYCRAIGVDRGVLVYADVREDSLRVRNGGPSIELMRLDPDGEPADLDSRLASLSERIVRLAA